MANPDAEARIYKALDEIIDYTTQWLAPLFGLPRDVPGPCGVITNDTCCDLQRRAICLSSTYLQYDSIIAHEVGHYLHYWINSGIYAYYGENLEETNLCELVADYAALMFSANTHSGIDQRRNTILSALETMPMVMAESKERELSEQEQIQSDEYHEGGCSAAQYLFERYGALYLLPFALLGSAAAASVLPDLGWRRPLFVPYEDKHKEYEIEEVDELGDIQMMVVSLEREVISNVGLPEIRAVG